MMQENKLHSKCVQQYYFKMWPEMWNSLAVFRVDIKGIETLLHRDTKCVNNQI